MLQLFDKLKSFVGIDVSVYGKQLVSLKMVPLITINRSHARLLSALLLVL